MSFCSGYSPSISSSFSTAAVDDTTRLQNCLIKCSECRFAVLPNVTAGQTLGGTISGFHLADHVQESGTGESVGHVLLCLVCVNYKGWEGSVAIADVPDSPLSTVSRLGLIPLAEPLAAQFTLTLLLLHHLQGDGTETGIRSVDAVLIELGLFHVRKIGWIGGKVNRLGTVPRPSHIVLSDGDELRVFNATGEGGALPPMVGLPFGPFVHDILNQIA